MDKLNFLNIVSEVMKGMVSHEKIMGSIKRSSMRGHSQNLEFLKPEEKKLDKVIEGINNINKLDIPEDTLDALILRYFMNTQFLSDIKENNIDVSSIRGGDLYYWKKAMLYKPRKVNNEQ